MLPSFSDARKTVVFPKTAAEFKASAAAFVKELHAEVSFETAILARNLCLDLRSQLAKWNLDRLVRSGGLSESDIDSVAAQFAGIADRHGSREEILSLAREEEAVVESRIGAMCVAAEEGKLATYWGHDYCTGMDFSLRRGARFVTSNPAKINLFRRENPETWERLVAEAKKENPGADIDRIISAMFCKITSINARALRPIYEATGGKDGFVCVQTNPKNVNDSEKMTQEVMYWQKAYEKELGTPNINVVYKLPAVKAAVRTAEELVARGIRICMTLNFTVSQHEIFADIIQKGQKSGFVVLMAGFLDDSVAKELEMLGVDDPIQYAKWAGVAVMRKSYANLNARRIDKASIMAAAIRGPYTIECCFTDRINAPVYFTTMPAKIEEFDEARPELGSHMDEPIPADVMAVLEKSEIFNQAYNRDRLDMDSVYDFVPLQMVLKAFTDAYVEIEKSLA